MAREGLGGEQLSPKLQLIGELVGGVSPWKRRHRKDFFYPRPEKELHKRAPRAKLEFFMLARKKIRSRK